jgi:archaellum component FlaC
MDLQAIFQAGLALSVGVGGYFFKRIQATLDRTSERIADVEVELARQKQEAHDVRGRLHRIEEKIDRLLDRGAKK